MMDERNQYDEDLRASYEGLGVEVLRLEEQLAAATRRADRAENEIRKGNVKWEALERGFYLTNDVLEAERDEANARLVILGKQTYKVQLDLRAISDERGRVMCALLAENRALRGVLDNIRSDTWLPLRSADLLQANLELIREAALAVLLATPLTAAEAERVRGLEAEMDLLTRKLARQERHSAELRDIRDELEQANRELREALGDIDEIVIAQQQTPFDKLKRIHTKARAALAAYHGEGGTDAE